MPNNNININFKNKKEKNNNNYNNLLQGSTTLLKRHESFPRSPSFNTHYYDPVGATQYASPTTDNPSLGR
jgi:hypothetical protein